MEIGVFLLHLSHEATINERGWLAAATRSAVVAAREFGNIDVVGRGDAMTKTRSSELAATLRGAATMLSMDKSWDWYACIGKGSISCFLDCWEIRKTSLPQRS